ncbi:MAG TPA: hypothetical protein VE088_08940 [Gaiellaceae bacterium]|nr:hypothetical protein [Gaiellaceae bacterium]
MAAVALVAAGCGGAAPRETRAASLIRCGAAGDQGASPELLWLDSAVYVVDGRRVLSSRGLGVPLPRGAVPVGFRDCRTPVVLYRLGDVLRAKVLASHGRTLTLGRGTIAAPDGRLVSFAGTRIRYGGGGSFAVRGLPAKWEIASVVPSPSDPHVFLASVQSPEAGIELCGRGLGGVYRVSPGGSKALLVDNPCHDQPEPAWSPDGSAISFLNSGSKALYTLSSNGADRHTVETRGVVVSYLWSPDGRRIAYESRRHGKPSVWVSTLRTGTHRVAAGELAGWSPDGREVAVVRRRRVVAVRVAGGRPQVLLRGL